MDGKEGKGRGKEENDGEMVLKKEKRRHMKTRDEMSEGRKRELKFKTFHKSTG